MCESVRFGLRHDDTKYLANEKKLCKPDGVWLWMNNKYNFICVQFKMCVFSFFGICNYHYQLGVRCIRIDTSLIRASVWVCLTMKTSGKNVFCILFRVTVVDVNRYKSTPPACVFLDGLWRHVDTSSSSYTKFLYTCDPMSLVFIFQGIVERSSSSVRNGQVGSELLPCVHWISLLTSANDALHRNETFFLHRSLDKLFWVFVQKFQKIKMTIETSAVFNVFSRNSNNRLWM